MFIKTFCVRLDNLKKTYSINIMNYKTLEVFKENKRAIAELVIVKEYQAYLRENVSEVYNLTFSIPESCPVRHIIMGFFQSIYYETRKGEKIVMGDFNTASIVRTLKRLPDDYEYTQTLIEFVYAFR
jgi:hypothetical protein